MRSCGTHPHPEKVTRTERRPRKSLRLAQVRAPLSHSRSTTATKSASKSRRTGSSSTPSEHTKRSACAATSKPLPTGQGGCQRSPNGPRQKSRFPGTGRDRGLATVAEGSIYPLLGRLERDGVVETYRAASNPDGTRTPAGVVRTRKHSSRCSPATHARNRRRPRSNRHATSPNAPQAQPAGERAYSGSVSLPLQRVRTRSLAPKSSGP